MTVARRSAPSTIAVPVVRCRPFARSLGRAGILGLVLCAGLLAAGCTSPRNALGTRESSCFKALPVASGAVHDLGHFAGVRYLTADVLARALASLRPPEKGVPPRARRRRSGICVVAFSGRFDASTVVDGRPPGIVGGEVALVVVRARDERLLATIVLTKAPLRLTRLYPDIG